MVCYVLGMVIGGVSRETLFDNIDQFMELLEDMGREKFIRSTEPNRLRGPALNPEGKRVYPEGRSQEYNRFQGTLGWEEVFRPKGRFQKEAMA